MIPRYSEDLTQKQYEDLADRAYADNVLKDLFIKHDLMNFIEYCVEHEVDSNNPGDYAGFYLEKMDNDFLRYAFNHYNVTGELCEIF